MMLRILLSCLCLLTTACVSRHTGQSHAESSSPPRLAAPVTTAPVDGRVSDDPLAAPQRVATAQGANQATRAGRATEAPPFGDIPFAFDSVLLSEAAQRQLTDDAAWLRRQPGLHVQIEGHADERGTVDYNFVLAERRAQQVRTYLLDLGIPASQLSTVSYGKTRPVCHDPDETCYQRNRRAHLETR